MDLKNIVRQFSNLNIVYELDNIVSMLNFIENCTEAM